MSGSFRRNSSTGDVKMDKLEAMQGFEIIVVKLDFVQRQNTEITKRVRHLENLQNFDRLNAAWMNRVSTERWSEVKRGNAQGTEYRENVFGH